MSQKRTKWIGAFRFLVVFLVLVIVVQGSIWALISRISPSIQLECDLPSTPKEVKQLTFSREMYNQNKAYTFARRFAGFTGVSSIRGSLYRHELTFGLYNLTFYGVGLSHLEFNMPFKENYRVESSFEQCTEKANNLIESVKEYLNSSLEYRVTHVEEVSNTNQSKVYYLRVHYNIYYNGVQLLGNGTKAWVEVSDDEILGYQLHFPYIEERGTEKVYLNSVEAINRLEPGSIVDGISFGYYADFVIPDFYVNADYGYLIHGVNDGDIFELFISAGAGSVYKKPQ